MTTKKNIRRLILVVGCASLCLQSLSAQISDPHPERARLTELQIAFAGHNYLGYQHDLPRLPQLPMLTEHTAYREAIARIMTEERSPEEVLNRYLKEHPLDLDRPSAQLLLGLVYLDQGLYPLAEDQLLKGDTKLLPPHEAAQHDLALGYLYLRDQRRQPLLDEAQVLLENATQDTSIVGEQALLYLGSVAWAKGDLPRAQRLFSDQRYSPELAPEAAYQSALLAFSSSTPEQALARAAELNRTYPAMAERPALRSLIGQTYFRQGNYAEAVRLLQPLQDMDDYIPLTEESYALGTSLYTLGQYQQAVSPLSVAAGSKEAIGAQSLFLLGNTQLKLKNNNEAALAYSAAGEHPAAAEQVREYALYNAILLNDQTQRSNFGKTIRMAEQFITTFPSSKYRPEILRLMKDIFLSTKDYAQSLATLERLTVNTSELKEAKQYILLRLGENALTQKKYPESEKYLTRAIETGGTTAYTAQAYLLRAITHLERESFAQAEADATKSIAQSSTIPLAYYIQGYARYNTKQYGSAYQAFDSYTSKAPREEVARRVDALSRMGDCLLIQKKKAEALALYRRANELAPEGSDEAVYRIAEIYGDWGQYAKQTEALDQLLKTHQSSTYVPQALYNKGRALILSKAPMEKAEAPLLQLIEKYPDSQYARLASMERAMLAYNSGKHDQAIAAYKSLIARYPDSDEARSALSDLRNIYIDLDKVDEYAAYASTLGNRLSPSEEERAHLQFLSLESRYKKDKLSAASDLENFIRVYPNSRETPRAQLLLAGVYSSTDRRHEAIALYTTLSSPARSLDLRIPALEALTELYKQSGESAKQLDCLAKLYAIEGLEAPQHIRYGVRLSQVAYEQKDYRRAKATASTLLGRSDLSASSREELQLLIAKSEEASGATAAALKAYEPLLKSTDSPSGAEGYVRHASLLLQTNKPKEAKKELDSFIAKGTSQQYWLARAFLLLADCYHRMGDTYVAKQYVESLQANYKGTEEDIKQMISERLDTYSK